MSSPEGQNDDLTRTLGELRSEVTALRTEVKRLAGEQPALPREAMAGWDDPAARADSHAWVNSLTSSPPSRASVPRWIPEIAFLVAAAAVVAVAELDPIVIVGVMAAAWVIVALVELAVAHASTASEPAYWAPSTPEQPVQPDPAWFSPPVEHTLLEDGRAPDSETAITRLPGAPDTTAAKAPST